MHTLLDYNAAKEFGAKEFTVYPKKYLSELMEEIEETKAEVASGKRPVFYTLDAMFANIEGN